MTSKKYYQRCKESENARSKAYYRANIEKCRAGATTRARKFREAARKMVARGEIKCVNCHCDLEKIIEVNHKNGGGRKELLGAEQTFFRRIVTGRRNIDDLELRCRVCNALHYVEMKYGPLPFQVTWGQKILK